MLCAYYALCMMLCGQDMHIQNKPKKMLPTRLLACHCAQSILYKERRRCVIVVYIA
jgi:hypothetical protein